MRILGFDTATMTQSVALIDDDNLISVYSLRCLLSHSQRLLTSIHWVLARAGFALEDLSALAVTVGPGSFTGLRIGLSTAKGLSFASGKPIVGVPTLDALASGVNTTSYLICPLLDARKKQVYTALYQYSADGALKKLTPDMALAPQELCRSIRDPVIFLGDGVERYGSFLGETLGELAHFVPVEACAPSALAVAAQGLKRMKAGQIDDPMTLTPLYIRRSEAEIKWEERLSKTQINDQ